jgi:hypothetical protein
MSSQVIKGVLPKEKKLYRFKFFAAPDVVLKSRTIG